MARRLRTAVFACLAVVLLGACDGGWIQPLAGPDHASYNAGENVLTLANVTTLQQAFHTSGVVGTPVVSQGVLVVGSGNAVTGFDATTGAQKWQQRLPDQINGGPFIDGTQVRVSYGPAYGQSTEQRMDLFSGSEDGLPPLPTSGAMVARRNDNSVRLNAVFTSPTGWDGFVQISGKALDGEMDTNGGSLAVGSLTLGQKYLYLEYTIGSTEQVAAFDPDQPCASDLCRPFWTSQLFPNSIEAPAIGPDGTLYVAGDGVFTFFLTALDGNTGSVKWTSGHPSVDAFGTPAVADSVVYSQTRTPDGVEGFAALSAADGHTLWTGTTPADNPAVAGGVVYGTNGSEVVAYNANGCGQATCAPIWTASLGTDTPSGGLAVTGGMLYVGTNTGVTAFKPTS